MSALSDIFTFIASVIRDYLVLMNNHWYTQVILSIVLLGLVVSTLVTMRK